MRMTKAALLFASFVLLTAVGISRDVLAADTVGHNARNALDWPGAYRGILPCADCEGIETSIQLSPAGRYSVQMRYLGREARPALKQGEFAWDAEGNTIILSGRSGLRYRVGENRLTQLAMDGTVITGALADRYILRKQPDGITEKYWKLVELNGKPVPPLNREPNMTLRTQGSRITGFGGCNNFTGTYVLDGTRSRIAFRQIAGTLRACLTGMETEAAFLAALRKADSYAMSGDHLSLNRARMAPLARFDAVYMK